MDEAIRTGDGARSDEIRRLREWMRRFFPESVEAVADTFRCAAALEAHPADRVRWYEARVRKFKEFELFAEVRARNHHTPPTTLFFVRFWRLQAEAELLELLTEVKRAGPGPDPPIKRTAFDAKEVRPVDTAFPNLKPPTVILGTATVNGFSRTTIEEKGSVPLVVPVLAPGAPALRRVQLELLLSGLNNHDRMLAFLQDRLGYSGYLAECLYMLPATFRLGAELEETTAKRIPWYEARISWLKWVAQSIEWRENEGEDPTAQQLLVRMQRLQAEADLLELQAATAAPPVISLPLYTPQPSCPGPRGSPQLRLFRR
jgi:hypothetical protein